MSTPFESADSPSTPPKPLEQTAVLLAPDLLERAVKLTREEPAKVEACINALGAGQTLDQARRSSGTKYMTVRMIAHLLKRDRSWLQGRCRMRQRLGEPAS